MVVCRVGNVYLRPNNKGVDMGNKEDVVHMGIVEDIKERRIKGND